MKKLFLMLGFAGATFFAFAQTTPQTTPGAAPQTAPAPDPNAPEFKWEETTMEYGTVKKGDQDNATREFKFVNTGKSALIISSCRGSCGCTVPTCPTEPILPGAKGTIKVHYDINRVGEFTKTVTVTSNAKSPNETLKIHGIVNDPDAGKPAPTATTPVQPAPMPAPVAVAPKPAPVAAAGPVHSDFDGTYNYQKKGGVWQTALKSAPDKWVPIADSKWSSAVEKLNARYPKD